eukprot:ctg_1045.g423
MGAGIPRRAGDEGTRAWPTRLEAPESCVETPYENGRRLMAASSASNEGAREGVASKEAAAPPRPDATASSADSVGARVLPPPPTPSPTMRVHKQRKIKGRTAPEPAAAHVCAAYCLASGYRLSELRDVLAAMPLITAIDTTQYANDVLHFRVGVAAAPDEQPHPTPPPTGHAFFFESGASVFWDVHEETRCELLRIARRCDTQPFSSRATARRNPPAGRRSPVHPRRRTCGRTPRAPTRNVPLRAPRRRRRSRRTTRRSHFATTAFTCKTTPTPSAWWRCRSGCAERQAAGVRVWHRSIGAGHASTAGGVGAAWSLSDRRLWRHQTAHRAAADSQVLGGFAVGHFGHAGHVLGVLQPRTGVQPVRTDGGSAEACSPAGQAHGHCEGLVGAAEQ